MSATVNDQPQRKTYSAKVTGRHAITLPAELCRRLHIEVGDTVEFQLEATGALVTKRSKARPPARGILRGSFPSWEAVNRYVAEERQGWDERAAALSEQPAKSRRQASISPNSSARRGGPDDR